MIISASYRTDIPAFYAEWFFTRLRAGHCRVWNPYSRQPYTVDLRPEAVDGIVFWTKNFEPVFRRLRELRDYGRPFTVQYTVTRYPRALEHSVIDGGRCIEHIRDLAEAFGPRCAVWRYDPILFTNLTPEDYHRRNFEEIARRLEGAVDEVVISFAQMYRKTRRNMAHLDWQDPEGERKRTLAREMAEMAAARGMQLSVCSQREYVVEGAFEARCVDAERLGAAGAKRKGNRPDCACHESRDIGDYDTCPHGCVYCYAVTSQAAARRRFRTHDPAGEFL